jgi:hypothetical protein
MVPDIHTQFIVIIVGGSPITASRDKAITVAVHTLACSLASFSGLPHGIAQRNDRRKLGTWVGAVSASGDGSR